MWCVIMLENIVKKLSSMKGIDLKSLSVSHGFGDNGNKGKYGMVIEKELGLKNNSYQAPDFGDAELKCVPLKYSKRGDVLVKETMAITMINAKDVMETPFEESHLYHKIKNLIVVFLIGDTIYDAKLFAPNKEHLKQIKKDYESVQECLRTNGFDSLSSSMGTIVQPRTKGSGHGSKSRAFYSRASFVKTILES